MVKEIKPLDKVIPINLSADKWEELSQEATELGIEPTTLVCIWILERLRRSPVSIRGEPAEEGEAHAVEEKASESVTELKHSEEQVILSLIGKSQQHPVFIKYTRQWLKQMTGYSEGYLSRMATGKSSLSSSFVDRVCFKLNRSRGELFLLEGLKEE